VGLYPQQLNTNANVKKNANNMGNLVNEKCTFPPPSSILQPVLQNISKKGHIPTPRSVWKQTLSEVKKNILPKTHSPRDLKLTSLVINV
jgi:hypothetical protein